MSSSLLVALIQAGQTQVSSGEGTQTVEVIQNVSQPSTEGSEDQFTGTVRIDPLISVREPVRQINPGDVVWIPPGVKHWHGAAPTTAMSHIALQEQLEGKVVEWMEQVSDDQYPN